MSTSLVKDQRVIGLVQAFLRKKIKEAWTC